MGRQPFIEVCHELANQWHIRVNPGGTKTLLVRPDLGYERTIELLEDLLQNRFDGCQVCSGLALDALGKRLGTARAAVIARLLQEMAEEAADEVHPDIVKPRYAQCRCADRLAGLY